MKAKKKPTKAWRHTGGGCGLGSAKYPCDDTYEHAKTKRYVVVFSTPARHQQMPARIARPSDLKRLTSIGKITKPKLNPI